MEDRRLESTVDPGHRGGASALGPPSMPDDARISASTATPKRAWVSFAAGLDGTKMLHRLTAWACSW